MPEVARSGNVWAKRGRPCCGPSKLWQNSDRHGEYPRCASVKDASPGSVAPDLVRADPCALRPFSEWIGICPSRVLIQPLQERVLSQPAKRERDRKNPSTVANKKRDLKRNISLARPEEIIAQRERPFPSGTTKETAAVCARLPGACWYG